MALKTTPDKKNKKQNSKEEEEEKKQTETINQIVIKKNKPAKKKNTNVQKDTQTNTRMLVHSAVLTPITTTLCPTYSSFPPLTYPVLPITTAVTPYIPISYGISPAVSWTSIVSMQVQNPLYSIPTMPLSPLFAHPAPTLCPYTTAFSTPTIAEPWLYSAVPTTSLDFSYEAIPTTNIHHVNELVPHDGVLTSLDPESYLLLPKDLFPPAKSIPIDPNIIIDQLCRESNIQAHSSWILDIEFGVPRTPVTRPIATYDVNYNSVHCKNTPGAIHPVFEKCSPDFKKTVLFYYDSVISTWYNGFVMINFDGSVANYQTWLQPPMQLFGLCWP